MESYLVVAVAYPTQRRNHAQPGRGRPRLSKYVLRMHRSPHFGLLNPNVRTRRQAFREMSKYPRVGVMGMASAIPRAGRHGTTIGNRLYMLMMLCKILPRFFETR